jgi:hypothetical protein
MTNISMDSVIITWSSTNNDGLKCIDDHKFYAFSKNGVLLYIGIAHKQHVVAEINQTINRLGLVSIRHELTIWYGNVTYSSYQRISESLVYDVECLLIFKNQPQLNTQCKKSYTGRENLKVTCVNMSLLMKQVTFKKTTPKRKKLVRRV